jgi:hypothetical protein
MAQEILALLRKGARAGPPTPAIRTRGSLALTMSLRSALPHPIGDVLVVAILGQPRLQLLHALASVFGFQLGNAGFWRHASPLHPLRKSG